MAALGFGFKRKDISTWVLLLTRIYFSKLLSLLYLQIKSMESETNHA